MRVAVELVSFELRPPTYQSLIMYLWKCSDTNLTPRAWPSLNTHTKRSIRPVDILSHLKWNSGDVWCCRQRSRRAVLCPSGVILPFKKKNCMPSFTQNKFLALTFIRCHRWWHGGTPVCTVASQQERCRARIRPFYVKIVYSLCFRNLRLPPTVQRHAG